MSTSASGAAYRFDRFVLYPDRGVLLSAEGGEIALRPKALTLLRLLVENAGRLLDRDTIMRAVWSDVIISDDGITQCVRDIRRALADDAQRILRTVRQRGYILAVEVTVTRDRSNVVTRTIQLADKPSIAVLPFRNLSTRSGARVLLGRDRGRHHHRAVSQPCAVRDSAKFELCLPQRRG